METGYNTKKIDFLKISSFGTYPENNLQSQLKLVKAVPS